jgi:4-amino-4-deoxy-L-arabinose transferase-like glycosyltransferase
VSRLTFHSTALEGIDSVHFAWALAHYDLVNYRPHFPGYPVYLAVSWLILQVVGNEVEALTLTAALFGSITLFPLYHLAYRMMGETAATLTALLFIVNPLLWLESSKAYSDTCGLFFLVTAAAFGYVALAQHQDQPWAAGQSSRLPLRPLYWGSLIIGVMLGARLAYIPFVSTWGILVYVLCRWRADRLPVATALHGLVVGIGLWLVPFLLKVSLSDIALAAKMNTVGTVYHYGDTLVTSHDYVGRAVQLYIWNVLVNGLGFWWPGTSWLRIIPTGLCLVALIAFWRPSRPSYQRGVFVAWLVPYGIWLYIAQNPNNPRHVLPLLPPLLMGIAAGLRHSRYRLDQWTRTMSLPTYAASILLIGSLGIITLPLVYEYRTTLPTRVQLVRYVTEHFNPRTTRVYCWWSRRFFHYYAPAWRGSLPRIERPLTISTASAPTILVTSDFFSGGFRPQDFQLTPIHTFTRNRYLHPWLHTLTLYRLEADYTQREEAR